MFRGCYLAGRASDPDPAGRPPLGGDPGQTQNSRQGFYTPSVLGRPRDPAGGAGECCWEKLWVSGRGLMDGRDKLL